MAAWGKIVPKRRGFSKKLEPATYLRPGDFCILAAGLKVKLAAFPSVRAKGVSALLSAVAILALSHVAR